MKYEINGHTVEVDHELNEAEIDDIAGQLGGSEPTPEVPTTNQPGPAQSALSQLLPTPQETQQPLPLNPKKPLDTIREFIKSSALGPGIAAGRVAMAGSDLANKLGGAVAETSGKMGAPPVVGGILGTATSIAADPLTYAGGGAKIAGQLPARIPTALERLATQKGLSLTPGELLQSKPLLLLERALENTSGGASILKQFRQKRIEQLGRLRDKLVSEQAPQSAIEKVGLQIQDIAAKLIKDAEGKNVQAAQSMLETGAKSFGASSEGAATVGAKTLDNIRKASVAAKDRVSAAFNELEDIIPQDIAIVPAATQAVAKEAMGQLKLTKASLRSDNLTSILNDFMPPTPIKDKTLPGMEQFAKPASQPMSWAQLKANREALTQLINEADASAAFGVKGAGTKDVALLQKLKSAMSQDMERLAQAAGPDVSEKYAVARAMHGEFKENFNNDTIRALVKLADEKPDRLLNQVFAPGRTTEITNMRKILGEQKFKPLQDRFTGTLFGLDRDGPFNPSELRQKVTQYTKDTLSTVYGKEGYESLVKLANDVETTGKLTVDNPFARALLARSPEKVMGFIIQPQNTTNIIKARAMMGQQMWDEAVASWLANDILAKNKYNLTEPSQFVKALDEYSIPTLKAALSTTQFQNMKQLGAISRIIQKAEEVSVNRSQTAGVSGMMGMITHPIRALLSHVSGKTLVKWYLNPEASRVLIEGLSAMPGTRTAANAAAKLVALSGAQISRDRLQQ